MRATRNDWKLSATLPLSEVKNLKEARLTQDVTGRTRQVDVGGQMFQPRFISISEGKAEGRKADLLGRHPHSLLLFFCCRERCQNLRTLGMWWCHILLLLTIRTALAVSAPVTVFSVSDYNHVCVAFTGHRSPAPLTSTPGPGVDVNGANSSQLAMLPSHSVCQLAGFTSKKNKAVPEFSSWKSIWWRDANASSPRGAWLSSTESYIHVNLMLFLQKHSDVNYHMTVILCAK